MAYNIGAKVTGKEWNDGHIGRAKNPAATYDGWGDMFDQRPSTEGVGVRHDLGVEPRERSAERRALPQDRQPAQAGLGALEDEELEVLPVVVDRHAPLGVVVADVVHVRPAPLAANDPVAVIGHRAPSPV